MNVLTTAQPHTYGCQSGGVYDWQWIVNGAYASKLSRLSRDQLHLFLFLLRDDQSAESLVP